MPNGNEFDLTTRAADAEVESDLSKPPVYLYDPSEDRERKRGQIALGLIGLLAGIAAVSLLFVMFAATAERADAVKGVVELLFGPIVGLVGAVTGFYFGAKSKD
jgi:hypothetical protein